MFSTVKCGAATLATAIAAYFLYALVCVPLIEPSAKFRKSKATASRPATRSRKLDHLFAPGSWELDRPKVVETDQGTLLFDDYKPLADGRLELTRCTVICYAEQGKSGTSVGPKDGVRRPIVLRALQGATLNFDRTLNIIRGEFGRLVGGRLEGEITISSPPTEPGRDDALSLVTRNVQLDARRIWTPHEVRFRYGPNVGTGRDLTIYLGGTKPAAGKPSIGLGGVKLLELVHLDRLDLQLNDSGLFGSPNQKPKTSNRTGGETPGTPEARRSVQITCRGPLRFDFDQQVISLEDHVDLMRHNLNGPSDQLLCQLLEIHFIDGPNSSMPSKDSENQTISRNKLTPSKVVATGYPVIIRAASVGVGTRAERLEYDCILRRIWLKDRDKVMLHDQQHNIEAKEIVYKLDEEGRLGDLVASGPGSMHGTVGTPARKMNVHWNDKVVSRRIENNPVVSFTSQVSIALQDAGTFRADTLHLYFNETPKNGDPKTFDLQPDRIHAIGTVMIESQNLSAKLNEAKVWLRISNSKKSDSPGNEAKHGLAAAKSPFSALGLDAQSKDANPTKPKRKFSLDGQLVEALLVIGDQPVVDRLVLRGDFELSEVSNSLISETPGNPSRQLAVRGNLFELQEGASDRPRAALLGTPAEVSERGMLVHGERFHVYPADNVLDIVGPGDAVFPAKALPGAQHQKQATSPGKIRWKKQMHFDGELASFEGSVVVNMNRPNKDGESRGVALGDILQARLTKRIDFQQPEAQTDIDLDELGFDGWAFFELEQLDVNGERKLTQQMQVRQLTINQTTGEVRGEGPGWLRGTHRGRDRLQDTSAANIAKALPISKSGLNFLRVDFAHTLSGNIHQRQLEFLQGTKTLYGPVDNWNDSLDQIAERELPPNAVVLTCERLAVAQMAADSDTEQIELEATGNAHVEGNSFSATGGRISYAHAKGQIILEGDGRNAATLAFQKQPGSPPSNVSADKIMYWPSTGQFEIDNLRPSNIFDVGQFRGIGSGENNPR